MGQLSTYFTTRFPGDQKLLIQLTNPNQEAATTVNATILAAVEVSAIAEFFLLTGTVFDTTYTDPNTPYQQECGFYGMLSKLYDIKGMPRSKAAEAARAEWLDICDKYKKLVGSLARQSPQTNSGLLPSPEVSGSLPYFDRKILENIVPRMPNPAGDDNPWPYYGQ